VRELDETWLPLESAERRERRAAENEVIVFKS
jgi:hypothetical protein